MSKSIDLAHDPLAAAAFTPEQRTVWNALRAELIAARAKLHDMEARIRLLERQPPAEDEHGILTRPEFNREVARMLAFDERYGGISSVLYFNFERVEETAAQHGRAVANAAIRQIGDVLIRHVRGSDVVGRLAADEFGVLLMRCDNSGAWRKGEQLAAALQEALVEIHSCTLNIGISYGAYTFHENEDVATGLKAAAAAVTKAVKAV